MQSVKGQRGRKSKANVELSIDGGFLFNGATFHVWEVVWDGKEKRNRKTITHTFHVGTGGHTVDFLRSMRDIANVALEGLADAERRLAERASK